MVLRYRSLLLLGSSVLMSCVQPAVQLHRASVAQVAARRIAHAHEEFEQRFQLPDGSLTEEASLERVDDERACFAVLLRSFSPVDLHAAEVSLRADGRAVSAPHVIAGAPTVSRYEGLISRRHRSGEKVQCLQHHDDGTCAEYGTVPTFVRRPERGDVTIHESRGRVCFAGPEAARAQKLSLEVRLELASAESQPSVTGGAFRKQVFHFATGE